ncbi:response regulator [Carboxydocella sp. ULO1]|uniref:response regulator n=1 Tax=Carboxydocella sp. ULO1 TaxID=1926599 RepID=UPI0009AE553D|nr:response regulator transcription factor [Carboxydocella sp. ULO1]GAW28129.1 two-component system, OmpR family, alkaline phosphatase synthesis response regulator PhoP [Carboxydocella sp. ULO1]
MATILLVDDDPLIVELVQFNLEKWGYQVLVARDGQEALKLARNEKPDLVILDLMLPVIDGLEVCRHLHDDPATRNIPIIMLTARGEETDKVLGLELGADDYMTKPFSPRELLARIKARLRRLSPAEEGKETGEKGISYGEGEIMLFPEKYQVEVRGRKQSLTPKECELLQLLMTHPGRVFSRDYLLEKIWGYDYAGDTRTVDVHIRHLRMKIEADPANPRYLETVRGAGYRMRELEQ